MSSGCLLNLYDWLLRDRELVRISLEVLTNEGGTTKEVEVNVGVKWGGGDLKDLF